MRRSSASRLVVALAVLAGHLTLAGPAEAGERFAVGLIGDTSYSSSQERSLLDTRSDMNRSGLAFAVHAGDIWSGSGSTACSDSNYRKARDVFNGFEAPFVYTPGDNETKDCEEGASRSLTLVRRIFFDSSKTLGKNRMTVTRQSGHPENARWTRGGVVFATMNEPGSSGAGGSERSANLKWLDSAFDRAESDGAPGVMVIWQDNSFEPSGGALYKRLRERTKRFGKPVVLVHGDTHHGHVDHPWKELDNFTRVEVYGDTTSGKWFKATIDTDDPDVFRISSQNP